MLFTKKIVVQLDRYKFYYWKILQSRIVSIPNFVFGNNNSLDIKLESKAPNFGIIYFGRFSFPKDLISMIQAFELFNPLFPNTTFDLYGSGEDLDFLRYYISQSKCANKINIYDPVQNMEQIIAKYSISCYLTFYDGFSNSVVESLAAGVPVIGYSNSDGVSDFIIDSVNGWLVHEFKNIDEIAKVYAKAYNQVNQDNTIFANSRKSVSQYVLNSHSSLWLDLLGN
jgi:glycosyltransferase involved in cell wall biosynthesis